MHTSYVVLSVVLACVLSSVGCAAPANTTMPDGRARATFTEIDDILPNPHMGWQTTNLFVDEYAWPETSTIAYYGLEWWRIEPEEGEIDFEAIDGYLEHAHRAGQKFAFRISCIRPSDRYMHVPQWLKDKGCPGSEFRYGDATTVQWVPDMDSPVFQEAHFRLLRALGERYDGHPDLDCIDIGSVGLWGEWHMSSTGIDLPSEETQRAVIDAYLTAFPTTPKLALIGCPQLEYAIQNGVGWRADCLGDMSEGWNHMEDGYPGWIARASAADAWQAAPVAFETCWVISTWLENGWDTDAIFGQALAWHASYINNKNNAVPDEARASVDAFLRRLGYRLVLRSVLCPEQVRPGEAASLTMNWENVGVAPPYWDYLLVFRLIRADGEVTETAVPDTTIKGWLPGTREETIELRVPEGLLLGQYELQLAVVDPATEEPAIYLAIDGRTDEGWYPLASLAVQGAID